MRLLKLESCGELSLTKDLSPGNIPPYAILSHTWGADEDEVTFDNLQQRPNQGKAGHVKLRFCAEQARKDNIDYFWVDTCCINKANHLELSEAITSMFRWYRDAVKCYVYLSDVSVGERDTDGQTRRKWESDFRISRWFTRGWTLQELLAPRSVEFFSKEKELLGNKFTLGQQIYEITGIPTTALQGRPLSQFPVDERLQWAAKRATKKKEDKAYSLQGIFDVFIPLIYGEEEGHAFERLTEEIDKRFRKRETTVTKFETQIAPPVDVHWMVTRSTNSLFTGREDVLQDLNSIIHDAIKNVPNQRQCRIVITGMGGQGKSEICLQLVDRLRQAFWGIFWIDVSTTMQAERSYLDVAKELSIPASTWKEARHGVAKLKHPWLLVLDNADDPDTDYQDYFPSGALGVILLTSRNDQCQRYATAKSITLEGLSGREARELLLKAVGIPQDQYNAFEEDAKSVADLLQSHPLALIQAGAYISRGHCTLAHYLDIYKHQRQQLLTFQLTQAQSRYGNVYATFEVSFETLENLVKTLKKPEAGKARDALQLLLLLAVGGSSRLPLPLFEAGWKGAKNVPSDMNDDAKDDNVLLLTPWHVARIPSLVDTAGDVWNSFRLVEAVSLLKEFALVSTDSHDGVLNVSMHPLIHAWARDRQDHTEQHQNWLQMGCLIAFGGTEMALWQIHGRKLQSHVEALAAWEAAKMFAAESPMMVARVLVNCGWLLYEMRADTKLLILLKKIFTHLTLNWTKVEKPWIGIYGLTARSLVDCGKLREAVTLLETVVKIREQSLAEDHPNRLASQHTLAEAYRANGQIKQAITLLEKVVKIEKQSLAEDHPDRLTSQHALARAYQANGQIKKAMTLLETVVKIQKQSLAEDHPDRLASQYVLAITYEANGQVKKAMTLLETVVKIQKQSLAEDHPNRLTAQYTLAGAYQATGQIKKAVTLLETVVKIQEQSLAEDHPNRLASQHALAIAYQTNGQVKKAVTLLETVVKIEEQSLAEDHPDRLASQHALTEAYRVRSKRQ